MFRRRLPSLGHGALLLVVVAATVTGCGKGESTRTTSAHTHAARTPPAYRGGQYCVAGREAIYRSAGFSCVRHHLAKR